MCGWIWKKGSGAWRRRQLSVTSAWGGAERTRFPAGEINRWFPHGADGELADQYQETLFRQLTFGMHVHVGVSSGEAAIRACNGVRRYLPLLLALSANSPFWAGRATGLHAHRAEVMSALPASGPPPRFHNWNDYSSLIERLISGGCIKTSKDLWWDVRPSPTYGTVEVRVCDMPPDLPSVLGLTAMYPVSDLRSVARPV